MCDRLRAIMTVMRASERTLQTDDRLALVERRWLPDGDPKAFVVVVHGYAEHSGRYSHVARALTDAGYAVHAADLRGHGRSEGPRALVRSVDEFIADIERLMADARAEAGSRPVFLLGHSMGGTIVARYALDGEPRPDGLVLSGAGLGGRTGPPVIGRLIASVLSFLGRIAPRLPVTRLDSALVSRDPAVVAAYDADPLVYRGRMKAGMLRALVGGARDVLRGMERISLPLLILHGTEDGLTDPEGSRRLHERAASTDKTLKLYDGLAHEIFNEPEQAAVLADLVAWLDARCATASHEAAAAGSGAQ